MNLRFAPHVIAGWLLFVPVLAVAGIWYVYLFVAVPIGAPVWDSAIGQIRHTFSNQNPQFWWFVWLLALPIACLGLGVAYLSNVARTRVIGASLLGGVIALGVATLVLNNLGLATLVLVPALWGYRALHAT